MELRREGGEKSRLSLLQQPFSLLPSTKKAGFLSRIYIDFGSLLTSRLIGSEFPSFSPPSFFPVNLPLKKGIKRLTIERLKLQHIGISWAHWTVREAAAATKKTRLSFPFFAGDPNC